MKAHSPAPVLAISAMVLALSACGPPKQQIVEVTRVVIEERQVTEEITRQVEIEVTREVTREVEKEPEPVNIRMWTSEDEGNGGLRFVQSLTEQYASLKPHVTFSVTRKDVDALHEEFLSTAVSRDERPDLLWTTGDHITTLVGADLILPLDSVTDPSRYVQPALAGAQLGDQTWGVPISTGNHLMLIYNKDLLPTPPRDSDEMITLGQELTTDDQYGLVYDQTDPLWLVPWLGGFGGDVLEADGRTPALDTPEMVETLRFLQDLVYQVSIVPPGTGYDGAYVLFTRGRAAMTINGSWALDRYRETLGDRLGVARLPRISSTGEWPHPYTSGTYLIFSTALQGNHRKLTEAVDFAGFVTSSNTQALLVARLRRLPALEAALDDPLIADDPILAGSAEQMEVGRPMPTFGEMACTWDAMRLEMEAVLIDGKSPEQAAEDMQTRSLDCVEDRR